jgi:hypothetical protein
MPRRHKRKKTRRFPLEPGTHRGALASRIRHKPHTYPALPERLLYLAFLDLTGTKSTRK